MIIRKIEKYNFFALDAIGASMSAFYLFLIYTFNKYFGMPKEVVAIFLIIAVILCLYSTIMYLIKPEKWAFYLKLIAILNYSYCLYTLYHVIRNIENLTVFGSIYFILEIIVIIALATYELRESRKATNA
jgi:hypothetical protein